MVFFDDLVENNIGYSSQLRKKIFNQSPKNIMIYTRISTFLMPFNLNISKSPPVLYMAFYWLDQT